MGNILSRITDKKEFFIYFIYNNKNDVVYIGSTNNFKKRKSQHKSNGNLFLGDDIKIIRNIYCNDKYIKILEQAYIDYISPSRNVIRAYKYKYNNKILSTYYKLKCKGYNDDEI